MRQVCEERVKVETVVHDEPLDVICGQYNACIVSKSISAAIRHLRDSHTQLLESQLLFFSSLFGHDTRFTQSAGSRETLVLKCSPSNGERSLDGPHAPLNSAQSAKFFRLASRRSMLVASILSAHTQIHGVPPMKHHSLTTFPWLPPMKYQKYMACR
jgi:hypothetical protein